MLGSQMGNTVKKVVQILQDPKLVRRIQETFGVKVISDFTKTNQVIEDNELGNKNIIQQNGDILTSLATNPIKKRRKRRRQTAVASMDSPPSSPDSGTPPRDLPDIEVETYSLFDIYFKLASECGYEPFYVTFFPFVIWNIDTTLGRHMVFLWCLSMYVGQAAKSIFKFRRPSAPPVVRLEINEKLEMEYGFPSTHATVCTVIPFYIFYLTSWRYQDLFYPILVIALIWWISVCTSRIYLGVHSVLDVIGGFLVAIFMLSITIPFMETFDQFILYWPYYPQIAVGIVLFSIYIYPVEKRWTMDRGDTCAILGVGLGITIGFNLYGPFPDDILSGPIEVTLPSAQVVGFSILRFIVGILLILPNRFIMKLLCFRLLPSIMPTHGVEEVQKRPLVELPYKIIVYTSIGLQCIFVPAFFEMCGIGRFNN